MTGATVTVSEALTAAGIMLRNYAAGRTHRAPCPKCNKGKRDDALGVTIDTASVVWHCFRCEWRGGWRPRDPMPKAAAKAKHVSHPEKPTERESLERRWR